MATLQNDVTGTNETSIVGTSEQHHGVAGESKQKGAGVVGVSRDGEGVSGFSKTSHGVVGQSESESGVRGLSKTGRGVEGLSEKGEGIKGVSDTGNAVAGTSSAGHGVLGHSESASAVRGVSKAGRGVEGWSESAYGVSGDSGSSAGVRGTSVEGRGVEGWSTRSEGVFGICESGTGVWGVAGRSRISSGIETGIELGTTFRLGAAAKQWSHSLSALTQQNAPLEQSDTARFAATNTSASVHRDHAPGNVPTSGSGIRDHIGSEGIDIDVHIPDVFDDTAGIGVCGEHRRAGIGVKAVSNAGIGLAAYSTEHEAVHAETQSRNTAAIAAYNLNPRGRGAAVYAKKVGASGHAGFFEGKVWISGELAVGGDILLANADCAEDFDVLSEANAAPGTVMVVGEDGVLEPCSKAYDKRVAGVISGAGQYQPGLILDKQASVPNRMPVALLGKVCCHVTADHGAIEVGDLLTTSPVEGHAMKASDPARSFGAVIGKALRPLRAGQGLIPILIALQ